MTMKQTNIPGLAPSRLEVAAACPASEHIIRAITNTNESGGIIGKLVHAKAASELGKALNALTPEQSDDFSWRVMYFLDRVNRKDQDKLLHDSYLQI